MKRGVSAFLILFLGSIFVGAQKIEMVNGVRVIHNEKVGQWGANLEVKLELVRTIGGLDAEESLSFNEPNDIVQDSAGNLYILDSGNNRIQKLKIFGPDGSLLGEISLPHHAHGIRIFGDNLFIREYYNTIFYQYKIIENERPY